MLEKTAVLKFLSIFNYLGPSPPIDFQSLCDVIVWGTPFSPNGDITGYEAQFYIPGTQNIMKIVEIAKDRTFYIVKENDNLDGDTDPFVRVCS